MTSARDRTNGDGLPRVPSIPLTDDAAFDAAGDQSIGHLVKDATAQLSTLIRAEVELAKSEVAKEIKSALTGSIFFVIALVVLLFGVLPYFFIALALGINEFLWDWAEPWGGFAAMCVVMAGIAITLAVLGKWQVKRIRAPQRTISSLKDTTAALTHRGNGEPGTEVSTDVAGTSPSRT